MAVSALVPQEVGAVAEGLAAVWALVGLLTRVRALVAKQVRAVSEGLAATGTLVGPLARVGALVFDEVRALGEGLATDLTFIGFSPVWMRWCWIRVEPRPKLFPQMPQMLGLGPCPPLARPPRRPGPRRVPVRPRGFWSISNWGGASRAPVGISNGGPRGMPPAGCSPNPWVKASKGWTPKGMLKGFFSSGFRSISAPSWNLELSASNSGLWVLNSGFWGSYPGLWDSYLGL